MASNPQCAALIAAKEKKGTPTHLKSLLITEWLLMNSIGLLGLSWAQVAAALGQSEQHVLDSNLLLPCRMISSNKYSPVVVNAKTRPTEAEFNSIAKVLGITSSVCLHSYLFKISTHTHTITVGPSHWCPCYCLKDSSSINFNHSIMLPITPTGRWIQDVVDDLVNMRSCSWRCRS